VRERLDSTLQCMGKSRTRNLLNTSRALRPLKLLLLRPTTHAETNFHDDDDDVDADVKRRMRLVGFVGDLKKSDDENNALRSKLHESRQLAVM